MSEPFIAEIRIFAGNFAPRGWAFCDGQLLPIAQNTALFSLIGTIYGGDGRSTTALPNMQGRAPMHSGNGPGLTSRQLGQKGGVEYITLNSLQIPAHNHYLNAHNRGNAANPTDVFPEDGPGQTTHDATGADIVGNTGGSQPHFNMQPFLTINFIIALVGLYPSRN